MKIVDLIKYEGDNTTFVWKHPAEDFNTMSQLIVHESQEALLFLNGQALDLFGPGRHTLHTQNIPLLRRIVNIPTGGVSPFHCEVYFINKTEQMAINWGMGDVNFLDPTLMDHVFKIGASGEMSLKISDSKKLIIKLVGTETTLNQENVKRYFKTPINANIKTLLPKILRERGVSIFEVESNLIELSQILKEKVSEEMADYGVSLEKFWINTIVKPENDPVYIEVNKQRGELATIDTRGKIDMKRAEYEKQIGMINYSGIIQQRMMDTDAKKYDMERLGYNYKMERSYNVMQGIAENEGSGSDVRNAALGVGMGIGAGGAFGQAIGDIATNTIGNYFNIPSTQSESFDNPIGDIPGMINLKEENEDINKTDNNADNDKDSFKAKADNLKYLKENGLLSDEEFKRELSELMKKYC